MVTCAVIAAIVVYTVDVLPRSTVDVDASPWNNLRLPTNIRATKYRLFLDINWANMTYTGTQEVTLNITGAARYILIHASDDLTLERNMTTLHHLHSLHHNIPVNRSFRDWEMNPDLCHDFYVVELGQMVAEGQYKMKLYFSGAVQTKRLTGMYRSGYVRQIDGQDVAVHHTIVYNKVPNWVPNYEVVRHVSSHALPLRGTYTSSPGREAKPGKKRLRRGQEAFGPKSEISVRNSIF